MKKLMIVTLVLLVCGVTGIGAGELDPIYTLVVPQELTMLTVEGLFGGTNVLQMDVDFSPSDFTFNVGAEADYAWYKQTKDTDLDIDALGSVYVGSNISGLDLNGSAQYRSHTLSLGGFPGFYFLGGSLVLNPELPASGSATIDFEIEPYGGIGIGRVFSITTIKRIELIMRHLGLVPTREIVQQVAEIMYTSQPRLLAFGDDMSKNYVAYYQAIADAMGAPTRVLDIVYIDQSQRFSFEMARYLNLRYGWEASVRLAPSYLHNDNGFTTTDTFLMSLRVAGTYASFLMEDAMHAEANANVTLLYNSVASTAFSVNMGANGTVRYFPENPRWWATGSMGLNFNSANATDKFWLTLNAQMNYLINPNFTVYGGLGLNTTTRLSVFAGGSIRLW